MRKASSHTLDILEAQAIRNENPDLAVWKELSISFGKDLFGFIDNNITAAEEDWKRALYNIEDEKIINLRYSIRSKIQTLRALRSKIEDAPTMYDRVEQILSNKT